MERETVGSDDFVTRMQPLCARTTDSLEQLGWRVVFAESCTAGLVSAALGSIAGVSKHLCGSAVTYRNRTKRDWLGVPEEFLDDPGPVSAEVVQCMAQGALGSTQEANVALAVTGHLGPAAPAQLDGLIHIGVACYDQGAGQKKGKCFTASRLVRLKREQRLMRQQEAAQEVLATLVDVMDVFKDWQRMGKGEIRKSRFSWPHHTDPLQLVVEHDSSETPRYLFPGSYNPRHEGHLKIAQYVRTVFDVELEYELSIANVDKPSLGFPETLDRLFQFVGNDVIWLTESATFAEKSHLFPQTTFVVGVDTIIRVADPKYYLDEAAHRAAIETIRAAGCSFLVFGRQLSHDEADNAGFHELEDLVLPVELKEVCQQVPATAFRCDISSTELRAEELED